MRIALFTETFLPKTDGIVNTLCHLLDHLARRGHTSVLFAPSGGPGHYAQTPVIGLTAVPFPLYPKLRLVPPTVDVSEQLRAFSPDLIHVFNPVSLGVAGLRHARQLGVPVAASYQTDLPGFAARWGLGLFSDLLWGYLRWVHDQADLNFCPSRFTLQELAQRGFRNLRVWGRGADTDRFAPRRASAAWRDRLTDGHPDAPLIVTVSRMAPEKRLAMLRPVIETLPQARLAIIGDGPMRWLLESQFAGTPTVFTGYLHGADLAATYASADMFVLTGANETFGNVVLEAMASGLPVVVRPAHRRLYVLGHHGGRQLRHRGRRAAGWGAGGFARLPAHVHDFRRHPSAGAAVDLRHLPPSPSRCRGGLMRITEIQVQPLDLRLQTALAVAYGSYPVLNYALLQIHTDDGLPGLGEASPDPEVTGETQAIVLAALRQAARPCGRA